MHHTVTIPVLASLAILAACSVDDVVINPPDPTPTPAPPASETLDFDFANGDEGFTGEISEYDSTAQLESIEFAFGVGQVPGFTNDGFLLSSINRSDDVFMFAWREFTGLTPNQEYRVTARISFATNTPPDCAGIGGPPGEAVIIQAGAAPVEPENVTANDGSVDPNFEHGVQSPDDNSGYVLGDFAQTDVTGGACDGTDAYSVKTLESPEGGTVVTSDSEGRLWPFMGTDSGFEGLTQIYFLSGRFTFDPI